MLTRFGELGVRINHGSLSFHPVLLDRIELAQQPMAFECHDVNGKARRLEIQKGMLAFTLCQVPVVYEKVSGNEWIRIEFADGSLEEVVGHALTRELSRDLFNRTGRINSLRVGILDRDFR